MTLTRLDGGTRAEGPIKLSARQVLGPIVTVIVAAGLLTFAANSGGTLEEPVGHRVYEIGIIVVAVAILALGIWQSVRAGRFSSLFLMSFAAGTAFWQETYGDWGAYLLYSARFAHYDWGDTVWTSPVKPWWVIAGYVAFYTPLFLSLTATINYVRLRWPNRNEYLFAALLSLPIFYAFDLVFEGTTTGLGLWNYTYVFGPALSVGNGTFPLLWPIVEQVPFMAIAAFGLSWRNDRGETLFDVAAQRVLRRPPGQITILVSWILIVNVTFLTTTILPILLMRWVAGPASALVP
ncbi:MAG: hypothetical protein ACXWEI_18220 [Mycobacterium sp.]